MNNNKTQKSCFGWVKPYPLLIAICSLFFASANAQTALYDYRPGVTAEGAVYFLPKTGVRLRVLVEKTSYKPGDFSAYAQRYLRLYDVVQEPTVSYRVVGITQQAFGMPDSTKAYAVKFNAKSVAANISLTSDGRLLAINATPQEENEPKAFKPAPKPAQVNPRQLMGEEILSAGSTAKMAELTAREIYDLRENRNLLIKGQADFMPSDGNQMQLMLNRLESQEKTLLTLFQGTTVRDTTESVITICPDGAIDRQVAFRLSQKLGVVDDDDLSGTPYYVRVENLTAMPSVDEEEVEQAKKKQPESGVYVNVPGKMRVSVFNGLEPVSVVEHPAGQLGNVELLSGDLFNKHYTTHLWLNPITGAVERLEGEQPK